MDNRNAFGHRASCTSRIAFTALVTVLVAMLQSEAFTDQVRLACTADTNISWFPPERDLNYGKNSRLRLKGIEMLALFQFNTAPAAKWHITGATLYLKYAGADRKLRTVGISTISAPWAEGTGTASKNPGETCFDWSRFGTTRWAGPDTDFTDVSYTAGNTIAAYADITAQPGDWFSVPVDPRIVQAIIAGTSYGLAVSDEKGQTAANNDVFSREQNGAQPYLLVEGSPSQPKVENQRVQIEAVPDRFHSDFGAGAAALTIAGGDSFAYDVTWHALGSKARHTLPRYDIPLTTAGKTTNVVLRNLPGSAPISIDVIPVTETGERGTAQTVHCVSSPAKVPPAALRKPYSIQQAVHTAGISQRTGKLQPRSAYLVLPVTENVLGMWPQRDNPLRIWAYPDTEKAHPVSGNLLEEVGASLYAGPPSGRYRAYNAVWDGVAVRLFAARNEIVGFHLDIEAPVGGLKQVAVTTAVQFRSTASAAHWSPSAELFRDWYIHDGAWYPEGCIPLASPFSIPCADNGVPGQRNQSIFCDIRVPPGAPPGTYVGSITVTAAGVGPSRIPIVITVSALTLPNQLSFDISLNAYGTVGGPFGIDDRTPQYRTLETAYHRMAHAHRSTLAILGYSHSGTISENYAPPLAGSGANLHVSDWSRWDAQFGPYFDGSAFADSLRKSVPITHFYLPFHEAWPVDIREHYPYKATVTQYPQLIAEHAMRAEPIEHEMDSGFGPGFTAVARQFAEHFAAKGWTHTMFQFYQNDKYYYKDPKMGGRGTSWWLLDEPNHRDDWLALAYFGRLFQAGMSKRSKVDIAMREDVSRPQWQRNYLDGLVDLMVVSDELYKKGPLLRKLREQLGVHYWNYGTANELTESNTAAQAWAVRAWLAGADAILPWQNIGDDTNYTHFADTAVLLPGKRFGIIGPVATLRLKSLRRAQQDVEYIVLLAAAKHWDREQVAAAISGLIHLKSGFHQTSDQDAGSYQFGDVKAADFSDTRRAIAEALAQ